VDAGRDEEGLKQRDFLIDANSYREQVLLEEAFKLLGAGSAFIYAGAIYGIFRYLDERASEEAKTAISNWLRQDYDKAAVAAAILEMFDRLYTRPLLGWRAFVRSALYTLVITSVVILTVFPAIIGYYVNYVPGHTSITEETVYSIAANIISDYVSLFFVRRWLILAGGRGLLALLAGPIVGAVIILAIYWVRHVIEYPGQDPWGLFFLKEIFTFDRVFWNIIAMRYVDPHMDSFFLPAMLVHSWLAMFAMGVLGLQLLKWIGRASGWTQWFLKDGDKHPLEAVGYVTGAFICIMAIIWKLVRPLMP
jgi:hypothetical protein